MSVLKAFNSHLIEFADDIIQLFPDDTNIKATKVFLSGLQKVNPKSIIVAWKDWIIAPYRPQIRKGDFEFFINKDYTSDVGQGSAGNGGEVLKSIEVIRARIRTMSKDNQEKSMKYIMSNTSAGHIPEEFPRIVKDFVCDVLLTFPEYKTSLSDSLVNIMSETPDESAVELVFAHCKRVYPERFFDMLYQNEEIFKDGSKSTEFLPGIDFANIWKQEISEKTRLIIWKYLQLVLFSVVHTQCDSDSFGETAKLFEAINETELRNKLEEAMEQMAKVFDVSGMEKAFVGESDSSGLSPTDIPNPEELHNHISGLLKGNLGKLATEITEETLKDLTTDLSGVDSVGDVFQTIFKNPGKLLSMIKKVGSTLDAKLKSGELKESELMEEAAELMDKMKSMPGMKNMQNMLGQMGLSGAAGKSRMNLGAMRGQMQQNIRQAKTKERMRNKLALRQEKDEQIRLLREQLEQARAVNAASAIQLGVHSEDKDAEQTNKKKKKKRKKRKPKNKK